MQRVVARKVFISQHVGDLYGGLCTDHAVFLGRTPDRASREDVRGYLLHLASSGVGAGTVNGTGSALRFFFDVTLDRADIVRHLPIAREPCKAPIVLSPEEVARMLEAAPGLKYKAALSVAYEAGLRVSEVVALKVNDIDSARMMIRIEQSKRRKDRYAMLSPRLLKKAASYASAVSKSANFGRLAFRCARRQFALWGANAAHRHFNVEVSLI